MNLLDDSAAAAVVFGAAETPPCAAGFTASSTVATSVGLGVGVGFFDRDGVGDGVTRPPVSRAASVARPSVWPAALMPAPVTTRRPPGDPPRTPPGTAP